MLLLHLDFPVSVIADLVKKVEEQKAEAERQLKSMSRQMKVRRPCVPDHEALLSPLQAEDTRGL